MACTSTPVGCCLKKIMVLHRVRFVTGAVRGIFWGEEFGECSCWGNVAVRGCSCGGRSSSGDVVGQWGEGEDSSLPPTNRALITTSKNVNLACLKNAQMNAIRKPNVISNNRNQSVQHF